MGLILYGHWILQLLNSTFCLNQRRLGLNVSSSRISCDIFLIWRKSFASSVFGMTYLYQLLFFWNAYLRQRIHFSGQQFISYQLFVFYILSPITSCSLGTLAIPPVILAISPTFWKYTNFYILSILFICLWHIFYNVSTLFRLC